MLAVPLPSLLKLSRSGSTSRLDVSRGRRPTAVGRVVRAEGKEQVEPVHAPRRAAAAVAAAGLVVLASGMNSHALAESVDFGMAAKGSAEYYGFGIQRGRLLPCPSGTNPNCVSTSSKTPDQYGAAWTAPFVSSQEAAVEIAAIAKSALPPESQIKESTQLDNGEYYLRYSTPGKFGTDYFEFLIRAEGVGNRNWSGDDDGGLLVTYRSIGNVQYLYPFQTPISDGFAQRKRMETIRQALGWKQVGCELVECYQ